MARDTAAPCGLWPPSSQTSAPSGAASTSGPLCQPLQPRRPFDGPQTPFDAAFAPQASAGLPQRGDGDGGILDLMAADQFRQRQIEQPVLVLIDHAAMFGGRRNPGRRHKAARPAGRRGASARLASSSCGPTTACRPRLMMPAFSRAMPPAIAEKFLMIQPHRL